MKSVLITGSNRGIGLELVRQFIGLPAPPKHVISTCRNVQGATELKKLSDCSGNVRILQLDVDNHGSFADFVKQVDAIVGDDGLNLLVNNAGVTTRFTRIGLVKAEQMFENFRTNAVAPLMVTKAVLPLLKRAAEKNRDLPMGIERAAVVNVSSILGSIQDNTVGGFYPYRCSKAALNAVTKSLSVDLREDHIMAVSVHPGWCKTSIGGPNAPLTVEQAISRLVQTLQGLTEESNGQFIQYDGSSLPW